MSTVNYSRSEKLLWASLAVPSFALIGAAMYIGGQLAETRATNELLLQEIARTQELLEQTKALPVSAQATGRVEPYQLNASALAKIIRSELKPITDSVARLKASGCLTSTQQPPLPMAIPGLPKPGLPNLPSTGGASEAKPASLLPFSSNLSEESRTYVESVFKENAEEARRRIAAEMDPQNPDPTALMRIMEHSREDLKSRLKSVLPQEDFEAMFPALPEPGDIGEGGVVRGSQTETLE